MREQMAPPLLFWAPPSTAEKGISHPPGFKRSAPNQHPRLRAFSQMRGREGVWPAANEAQ